MEFEGLVSKRFDELQVCVIIPTYNNHLTLGGVIADVAAYSSQIIVVNDGSTDDTEAIVKTFPHVQLISYPDNVGKGWALRQAFTYAMQKGYKYAITIDSDGQHFAKDIPAFLNRLEQVQDAIIIGSRNMDQAAVPGKSSFGHKFSNFWFWVETGIHCPDTQSGFRLYPLYLLEGMKFYTRKYEFEIEVIVKASWRGVHMDSVPVSVYYAPKETRVSHFRPFTDFSRVGVLNAFLVVIAFVWIKPRDFFLNLSKKKGRKKIIATLYNPNDTDEVKALSIGLGIFMGIVPIWGFQLAVAIFLSIIFKLNKALVVFSAHISIPPMIPVVIFLSYKAGEYWMGDKVTNMAFSSKISFKTIGEHMEQYIYGSLTLAVVASLTVGLITYALLKLLKKSPAAI
jgi:glycosyltransferase involved in cell wall biosynthesis